MTDIDAIIAEATAAAANAPATPANDAENAKPSETDPTTTETNPSDEEDGSDDDGKTWREHKKDPEFSNKAVNAISRRDRKIGVLQAQRDEARRELEKVRAGQSSSIPADLKKPEEKDFKDYGEFLDATARYHAQHHIKETQDKDHADRVKNAEKEVQDRENAFKDARIDSIDENAKAANTKFPDFEKLMQQHSTLRRADGQMVVPLSGDAMSALLESDNGAFALYSILKDGALDELNSLSPARAAMMVARHEDKAVELSKVKKISSAPEPISSAKGTASGGKSLDNMSWSQMRDWLHASG